MLKHLLLALALVSFTYGECPTGLAKNLPCFSVATTCYCFSYEQVDWSMANSLCRGNAAHPSFKLVSIESAQEQSILEAFISDISGLEVCNQFGFWTSGTDAFTEGAWTWSSTGDRLTFVNWNGTQPDNASGNGDCLVLSRPDKYKWDDQDCNELRAFICEGPA